MRVSGCEEPHRFTQLLNWLPQEAWQLVAGISSEERAWEELDAKYGNREVTILQTMSKLIQAELPAGTAYNKVEVLVSDVRTASNSLKAVGAEEELFASCFTVDTLTNKLNDSRQYRWFHYQVTHLDTKKGESFS